MADWQTERQARDERLAAGSKFASGKLVPPNDTTALLEAVIRPGDRICLEGDNQKQADFLAARLAAANPPPHGEREPAGSGPDRCRVHKQVACELNESPHLCGPELPRRIECVEWKHFTRPIRKKIDQFAFCQQMA